MARLMTSRRARRGDLHGHERPAAVGFVARERDRALEQVGPVARLDTCALTYGNRVLDLLVARLHRQRDHHLVEHLPHHDELELLERADRLIFELVAVRAPLTGSSRNPTTS
jgi:hypothetical protein